MPAEKVDISRDYNGNFELRERGVLMAELVWCANPTDWTRFGWLLHVPDEGGEDCIAVFRVGSQPAQEALWAKRSSDYEWRVEADTLRDVLLVDALEEAARVACELA